MLHEIVMASMLPKPQQPTPADPPLFSISTPIWATLVLRPNRRCNATTTQTSAVRYTAGIEKKTHLGGEFRCHKSSGLAVIAHSWLVGLPEKSSSSTSYGRFARLPGHGPLSGKLSFPPAHLAENTLVPRAWRRLHFKANLPTCTPLASFGRLGFCFGWCSIFLGRI